MNILYVIKILALLSIATALFFIPLYFKYSVFKSSHLQLTSSDIIPLLGHTSSFWCQTQIIRTNFSSVNAYLVPELKFENERVPHYFRNNFQLSSLHTKRVGLHLLEGSSIKISLCAKLPGSTVSVLKGKEQVKHCIHDRRLRLESEEGDESSEETDEGTSSISSSQGVISNESKIFHCPQSISHVTIFSRYRCDPSSKGRVHMNSVTLNISQTDTYYLFFTHDPLLQLITNLIHIEIELERTTFEKRLSVIECSEFKECIMHLPFGMNNVPLVESMPTGIKIEEQKVELICVPRQTVFLAFDFAAICLFITCAFQ